MENITPNEQLQGSIKDYFSIDNHLVSIRSVDAYQATDLSGNQQVTLWISRKPITANSSDPINFLNRMQLIESIVPRLAGIIGYGIDRDGLAFVVMEQFDGYPVNEGNIETGEAERRFIACVSLIARMHDVGLICGDISASSFWVGRTGDIKLNGVVGSIEYGVDAQAAPIDTINYLAPEQLKGLNETPESDVFALGVLGYYLLTRQYPYNWSNSVINNDQKQATPISEILLAPPPWANVVLEKCLNLDPATRFANAHELYQAIIEVRKQSLDAGAVPARRGSPMGQPEAATGILGPEVDPNQPTARYRTNRLRDWRVYAGIILGGVIGMILAGYIARPKPVAEQNVLKTGLQLHKMITGKDLSSAIDALSQPGLSLADQEAYLETISASDDPVAHDVLLTTARNTNSPQLRASAEKAIIERSRRLGMIRSSEEVKSWLQLQKDRPGLPVYYEPAIKSLDTTLPIEARSAALRQAYAANPAFVLRLAAALALDSKNISEYQPVLAQLIGDAAHLDDATTRHPLALIAASSDLAAAFGDDIIFRREELPDQDVLWAMQLFASRHDIRVRALANLALERNLTISMRKIFLELIRDRSDLPLDVMQALVRAATGTLRREDISNFGRWYDVSVEDILFGVCADSEDEEILVEAFDTLGSRSLAHEPGASLVEWVRMNHWNERKHLIHSIGVLSNLQFADEEAIKNSLQVFDEFSKDQRLLGILMRSENAIVTRQVVDRYGKDLGIGRLLTLLRNQDNQVKIKSILALKDFNDVGALRLIIEAYEKESDPEVKKAYEEGFWFIKERVNK